MPVTLVAEDQLLARSGHRRDKSSALGTTPRALVPRLHFVPRNELIRHTRHDARNSSIHLGAHERDVRGRLGLGGVRRGRRLVVQPVHARRAIRVAHRLERAVCVLVAVAVVAWARVIGADALRARMAAKRAREVFVAGRADNGGRDKLHHLERLAVRVVLAPRMHVS